MKFLLILLFSFNAEAGLFDFLNIYQANNAYENQQFKLAGEKFNNIDNDAARLNQANSLYKQGLYEESLEKYQSVKQDNLSFDRLYNSGNAYAKLGQIDQAIDNYKAALKLKADQDAKFNLGVLKLRKKKQKQKNNKDGKKSKDDKKKDGKKQGKQKKNDKNKDDKKKSKQKNNNDKKDGDKKASSKQQQRDKLDKIKQQRWEKSLNKNLRTLIIPLNNQQNNNEQKNPW